MTFIAGKVALVTGGASGIGFYHVKELLKRGIKGATIADVNAARGQEAAEILSKDFGPGRVVFLQTDVSDKKQFEDAFKKTIEVFGALDILVNNAGVFDDRNWEREIAINLTATVHGCILGMFNYLSKYKTGSEGVIVNMASITGLDTFYSVPVYAATKHAVVGLSRSLGAEEHYARYKVRVVTLCPGPTDTELFCGTSTDQLLPNFELQLVKDDFVKWGMQKPEIVAETLVRAIEEGHNGSVWVVSAGKINEERLPDILSSYKL